jgi:PAS domain S-box-containing protein
VRGASSRTGNASGSNPTCGFLSERQQIDYQKIFEGAPALFLLLGAEESFPILDASDAYLSATYTERDVIVGRPLFEVFPDNPEEQGATGTANLRSSLKRVLADGRPDIMAVQKYDIRRPASKDGGFEERYWSPVNAPVFGPDGRMLHILHRVEDVTELAIANQTLSREGESMRLEVMLRGQELQEANRQLQEATEQFRAMFEQGLFAARLRLDGTVIDINRAAVEVCGLNRADILDRPFWECGWWNRSSEVQAWVRNAVEQAVSGEPFRGESRYFWGDDSEHIVDFACMPIRDAAGRVVVVVPTGMDITERVQAEQNQRALEAERRRAEALAEIDGAKTQFFSNVSHEFRTPLNLILGPITDALETGDGLAGAQLELAHRNSLRLLKHVNSLLDFSRIEAGRAQAAYAPTDLTQLTAELASNFRSACERAGLTLAVDCRLLSAPVHVDRDMWEKIVLNLLSNAFKFTFDGGIEMALEEEEGGAVLMVRDTGVGIPKAEIGRLFERFHRIEGQRSRTHEGSGIGLALVAELVKLHGGTIAVDSAVGRGTTFTVRIPFGIAHLAPEHVEAQPAAPTISAGAEAFVQEALRWLPGESGSESSTLDAAEEIDAFFAAQTGGRVLLADDNADMRDYVRRLLHGRCEVRSVGDGSAALREMREHRPDLVLADVMMPEMDGFELLRQIRGDPTLRDIPVVLLSARAGEESRVEGLAAGANDYLVKPFAARELVARVGVNLELARVRAEGIAALRELNESLAHRVKTEVAERMKAEEALRQAQKMEAIGHLTGGVAHDFNNLLQVVLGNLDRLKRRIDGAVVQSRSEIFRAVEGAMRGAERAASLTQRLLAFSRRQPLEPRPIDVNRLVTGMSELLSRTLGESIAIETVLAGGLWRVFADPNQLENSVINLAVNARDAMLAGGKLTIETSNAHLDEAYAAEQQEVQVGQYVMLAISDTGIGMSKEVIASAFDPFLTTKDIGQGTGLGLSQVYGFVKQSNGHVKIYSEPGEGTTIRIYLPRLVGEPALVEEAPVWSIPSGRDGEIVLLVEDDAAVRELNAGMLRELNYAVIEAEDAARALQLIEMVPNIGLLFTDVGLPGGVTGRQLAEAARRLRPKLRVLFTSGYARNAIVHHGRLDPGIDLISKPFSAAALASKIRELLDKA